MKEGTLSRLGPYEIVGKLGAGGMGEVYRARDARLRREVALKILPQAVASDPERQRRFAQEAIAASALNHPNILAVYDVGVDEGVHYLVSELVEGAALRDELQRGRIALKRLLDLAVQVAHGLAAAHAAGIVHRDLKPENIMVTRTGRVKIVDFGLAKMSAPDGGAMTAAGMTQTATGLVVGTVPYMSPEQATGEAIDYRSDQFSLGLVLYEMASGGHAFKRATGVQTLSAIVGDEPKSLGDLKPPIPVALRWAIERCLAKTPGDRYASTTDLAADLQQIRDRLAELPTSDQTAGGAAAPLRRARRRLLTATIAAATFVIGSLIGSTQSDAPAIKYTPLATDAGFQGAPAWSPDGKTLAYVAEVDGVLQVFTRSLTASGRAQVTRSRFDCHDPYWSADGTRIYYHSFARENDALWVVSAAGGPADVVVETAAHSTLSPDGKTLAIMRQPDPAHLRMGLWFSSPPGAEPKPYKRPPFATAIASDAVLRYSPDGSKLLIWMKAAADSEKDDSGFWIVRDGGGDPRMVLSSLRGPRAPALFGWLSSSREIVVVRNDGPTTGAHLWIGDIETGRTRPLTVTNGNEGSPAVTPDGNRLAFTSEATDFDLALVPVDGSPVRSFLSSTRNELDPAWSPVAPQYAFVTDRSGAQEIWLRSETGDWERPVVTDADFSGSRTVVLGSPAFSPDGQRLAYQRFAEGGYRIWISRLAGGPPVRLSTANDYYQDAPNWSADGDWVVLITENAADEHSLVKVRIGSEAAPVLLRKRILPFTRPQWSPDGKSIVCQTLDGMVIVPANGGQERLVSEDDWLSYAWAADGRHIYGLRMSDDQHHYLLASVDAATGRQTFGSTLGTIPQANQPIRGFSRVRNEGFLTSIARVRSDIWLLEGLLQPRGRFARFWPFSKF